MEALDMDTHARRDTLDTYEGGLGMPDTYTTRGAVRGACGHTHRTLRTALTCLRRDERACTRQGGYSDRVIVRVDGQTMQPWEVREMDSLDREDGTR